MNRPLTFYHGKINKNEEITIKSGKQSKSIIKGTQIDVTKNKNGMVAGIIVFKENASQRFSIDDLVGRKNTNGFVMKLSENNQFGGIPFRIDKKSFKEAVKMSVTENPAEYLFFKSEILEKPSIQYFFKFKKYMCSSPNEQTIYNEDENKNVDYEYQYVKNTLKCDYTLYKIYFNLHKSNK